MRPIFFEALGLRFASAPIFAGLAALLAYWRFHKLRPEIGLSDDDFWSLMACLAFGVMAGSVGFYALAYGDGLARNLALARQSRGVTGGSFIGAWAGATLAAALFCKARRRPLGPIADALGSAAPLGLVVMRVGCLLNGCCHGRPTRLPWGISLHGVPLHPTQLYEAAGAFAIFLVVDRLARPRLLAGALKPGDGLTASVGLYGALRFAVDFARAGDPGLIAPWGLTLAQWAGAAAAAVAAHRWARGRG